MLMLRYFIRFLFFCGIVFANAQKTTATKNKIKSEVSPKDSIVNDSIAVRDSIKVFPRKYGLRFGADIAGLAYGLYDENFKAMSVVADYRITRNVFVGGEAGYMYKKNIQEQYTYRTDGFFTKFGLDYNVYNNWLDMDNEIYFGLRYAFSFFTKTLDNYTIFQRGTQILGESNRYFPAKKVIENRKYVDLDAHWMEISLGVRTEIFSNFYAGVQVAFKKLLSSKDPEGFKNFYIPGFYTVYEGGTGFGVNYTLTYRIPIYKK